MIKISFYLKRLKTGSRLHIKKDPERLGINPGLQGLCAE